MKINEMFYSIQGESTYQGFPCFFIRTTGCNLRCSYCDTAYAYNDGYEISPDDVLDEIGKHNPRIIEITGGEPLLQQEIPLLGKELLQNNYTVLLETNGSINIDLFDKKAIRVVDIKCPSSGMNDRMDFTNLQKLTQKDQLKFVIGNREDYEWAKKIIEKYGMYTFPNILFIPVYNSRNSRDLAEWILKDNLQVRFQLQLHKVLWGGTIRGR